MKDHPRAANNTNANANDDDDLSYIDYMLLDLDDFDDDSRIWDDDDLFDDSVLWDTLYSQTDNDQNQNLFNTGPVSANFEVGSSSGTAGDRDDQGTAPENNQDVGTVVPLQMLAAEDVNPTPPAFSCSGCQLLREIVHTNGTHTSTLRIYGRVGLICHAILENHYASIDGLAPGTQDSQMLDFSSGSLENIRGYIQWYLEDHRNRGYTLLQDPSSFFYEALCTGFDWVNITPPQPPNQPSPAQPPLNVPSYPMPLPPGQKAPSMLRPALAVQRERTKTMTIVDFAKYFDLRIEEAARKLNLCTTVIKRKVRSFNISRWPFRKVKSLKRKIEMWSKDLELADPEVRARAEAEIERLEKQINDILSGNVDVLNSAYAKFNG